MTVSKKITLGGILSATVLILLYLASTLPTSRLFLLALCSFAVSAVIIETGVKNGIIFYLATSILAFLLVPAKSMAALYILFFGIYGIAKAIIEKHGIGILQYIIKLVIFNLSFLMIYLASGIIIDISDLELKVPFPAWVIVAGLQFAFLFYDYVFTIVITFYYEHIHHDRR